MIKEGLYEQIINEEVLENLKNSKILRTDLKGTIGIKINRNKIKINYTLN